MKERTEKLEYLQVEGEPVKYKQNDKSCALPFYCLKYMSSASMLQ
jgi:hypothetical protein